LDFERLLEAGVVEAGGLYVLQHPTGLQLPIGERRRYGHNCLTIVEADAVEDG
jgi:hypothetical protein